MGNPTDFLRIERAEMLKEPVSDRIRHDREFERPRPIEQIREQGARCMDCGVPFCHWRCPLGSPLPDIHDLVFRGRDEGALRSLLRSNCFPELTSRLCPALCEAGCVLGEGFEPVSIRQIEQALIELAFDKGWITPKLLTFRTGRRIAVIGSGPAGLAAAFRLNQAGHTVRVYERDDRIGGLLRYGIPDFKLDKSVLDRRLDMMRLEGVSFEVNRAVCHEEDLQQLRREHDAVVFSTGARRARDLEIPGRNLAGIHLALDFLGQHNRLLAGDDISSQAMISARDKRVVVIGGGDTGSDCIGVSVRQGARSVTQIEILPEPPGTRAPDNPWPQWPRILRTTSSQEEGCQRLWSVRTTGFLDDGHGTVKALKGVQLSWRPTELGRMQADEIVGSDFELATDLVILAMGFTGSEIETVDHLGLQLDAQGNIATDARMMTNQPGVFAAGDSRRGQSLVVWAIAEGMRVASEVDRYLQAPGPGAGGSL